MTTLNLDAIPAELKTRVAWVLWKREARKGKLTKVLVNPSAGKLAKTNDPSTWASFPEAVEGLKTFPECHGIGYVFSDADPYVGVDLDQCVGDDGTLSEAAQLIVDSLPSYWEVSQSGRGVHGIVRGSFPGPGRHSESIEMYQTTRFFVVTGDRLEGALPTIEDCSEEVLRLHARTFPPPVESASSNGKHPPVVTMVLGDHDLLERARRAENGDKFRRLFDSGDISGYKSQSEADLALADLLAFWSGRDADQIDRLFRQSSLMRGKWEKHSTYGPGTIAKAIAGCREVYTPGRNGTSPERRDEDAPPDPGAAAGADTTAGEPPAPPKRRGPVPLWEEWLGALTAERARLIWAAGEAYVKLHSGELWPLCSDSMALWLQERCDREAFFRSEKFTTAAGALRSYARQCGEPLAVYRQAKAEWSKGRIWIGCEDEQHLYRITPAGVELLENGTDGVLILGGVAPALTPDQIHGSGELNRFLVDHTWATPLAKITLAISMPLLALGAEAFDARPLILAKGRRNSGKTTTLQMLGTAVTGRPTIAQKIKAKEEQNEARIVNERFAVFDNIDQPPRGLDVEDFLATSATMQLASIRKMRTEGETVEKSITAFVGVTSFTIPPCLRRADVIDRFLVCEFVKPEGEQTATVRARTPDRPKLWAELLLLLQEALCNWGRVPKTSTHRSIEFMQMAHALLAPEDAHALEQSLIALQGRTAGINDEILAKIEEKPPPRSMTARELLDWWWTAFDSERPKSPISLGKMLGHREGTLGGWKVASDKDALTGAAVWEFTRETPEQGMKDDQALALLRNLVEIDAPAASDPGTEAAQPGTGDRNQPPATSPVSPVPGASTSRGCTGDREIECEFIHSPRSPVAQPPPTAEQPTGGRSPSPNLHSISLSPVQPGEKKSTGTGDREEIGGDRNLSPGLPQGGAA